MVITRLTRVERIKDKGNVGEIPSACSGCGWAKMKPFTIIHHLSKDS